jgi:prevent-host-death family protein
MEKNIGIAEARGDFSRIVEQVQYKGRTYIINRHGKPAAAVVPMDVYQSWKKERRAFLCKSVQISP